MIDETETDEVFSLVEAAAYLRVHPRTVLRWRRNSALPAHRARRKVLFTRGELLKWVKNRPDAPWRRLAVRQKKTKESR